MEKLCVCARARARTHVCVCKNKVYAKKKLNQIHYTYLCMTVVDKKCVRLAQKV